MRKKGVALVVAALLIAALPLGAGAQVNPFSDVRADHWAYDAIIKLAAVGLIEGYPDGTFGGDRTFTRYEMAMVFARMLARLERLIDEKIAEGIDLKTEALAQEIASVYEQLSQRIDANYDDLAARIRALELQLEDHLASYQPAGGEGVLTDEARAALAAQLADQLREELRALLQADLDELARRIAGLEEAMLDERDVERIARRVIADVLGVGDDEVEKVAGDVLATARLVEQRVDELESAIAALENEFRSELDQLGVRVSVLESRVDEHDRQISEIRARLGSVKLSGKNETTFEHTAISSNQSDGKYYADPREEKDEVKRGNEFRNQFTLTISATPAENVTVKADISGTTQLGETEEDKDDQSLTGNLWVTTPGVLRSLHVGELDRTEVAESFSKYVLFANEFDDPDTGEDDKRGAHVDLVWGQGDSTNLHAFVSRVEDQTYEVDDAVTAYGGLVAYKLSDAFDLKFSGVRYANAPETVDPSKGVALLIDDRVYAVESKGVLESLQYNALFARAEKFDATAGEYTPANAAEAHLTLPVAFLTASFDYGKVDLDYNPKFAKKLDAGKDMEWKGLDWLERHLTPAEDWLDRGESTYVAKLSAPIFGLQASASFGRLVANSGDPDGTSSTMETVTNDFVQAELTGLNWAGITAGLLYDRRTDENDDVDNTLRATLGTTVLGADIQAIVHNRKNEQTWTGAEDQRHTWVTAKLPVRLLLPLTIEARYGTSETSGTDDHSYLGVSLDKYPVGPFKVSAGYSVSQNDVDAEKWWINNKWTNDKVDTATFGLGYTLVGFFGTDIETSYEYKLVRKNDADYGTPRNTFKASFEKELRGGEAKLVGEGKYVTGGTPDEKSNGRDVTAKLTLTYPIFEGANLTLGGLYASSRDNTILDNGKPKPEYTVYKVNAGLSFEF